MPIITLDGKTTSIPVLRQTLLEMERRMIEWVQSGCQPPDKYPRDSGGTCTFEGIPYTDIIDMLAWIGRSEGGEADVLKQPVLAAFVRGKNDRLALVGLKQ